MSKWINKEKENQIKKKVTVHHTYALLSTLVFLIFFNILITYVYFCYSIFMYS